MFWSKRAHKSKVPGNYGDGMKHTPNILSEISIAACKSSENPDLLDKYQFSLLIEFNEKI